MRLRQQLDVVALRLTKVDEGDVLLLWLSVPSEVGEMVDEGDDFDDDLDLDSDVPF